MQTRDAGPAPKKEGFPRPVKITKTCGAQRGKVDFNPLKFERKDLNYPNYVLGFSRFTLSAEKTIGQWRCIVCIFLCIDQSLFKQWCASSLTGAESYGMDWGLTKQSGRTFGGSGRPFLAVGEFTTWQKDPQNMGGKVSKHDKEVIFIQFLFAWTESLGGVHPRDSFESGTLCRFSRKQGSLNCHLW